MDTPLSPAWALSLLLPCFLSFSWAIRSHFQQPEGMPAAMRLLGLAGLLGGVANALVLAQAAPVPAWRLGLALLAYLLAFALFWWAVLSTRRQRLSIAYSADQPDFLVQRGPYAWIRHPFYSAYLLFWLSGAGLSGHPLLLGVAVLMGSFYFDAARREEAKFLASEFAASYRAYRQCTGLFWPGRGVRRSSPAASR